MDPLIDKGANGIEIRPESPDEIEPGDVISYESKFADGIIIHRVIEKGTDDNGVYFITKGDNNPIRDPEKVHFEQVKGILVGVIY
jgi:signal peptidase